MFSGEIRDDQGEELKLVIDPQRRRLGSSVDMAVAHAVCSGRDVDQFRALLFNLNIAKETEVCALLNASIDNALKGAR